VLWYCSLRANNICHEETSNSLQAQSVTNTKKGNFVEEKRFDSKKRIDAGDISIGLRFKPGPRHFDGLWHKPKTLFSFPEELEVLLLANDLVLLYSLNKFHH
jgi:hypothetical protein